MVKFQAAAVFSNHMVLQRNKNIKVFGQGNDGREVTVTFRGITVKAVVKNARWVAMLPPMEAGEGFTMSITCDNEELIFEDVAVGEVWLAGGQSNMEFELQHCIGGVEAIEKDEYPNVRFYYTQKNSYMDERFYEMERASGWEVFGGEGTKAWSAVGYFFGKKLAKELGVPVGIIGCNWGGTSASTWLSKEALEEDVELRSYIEDSNQHILGKSLIEQKKEYDEYIAYQTEWDKRAAVHLAKEPKLPWRRLLELAGPNYYPGPINSYSPFRPGGLYQCMVQRIMPYTLQGFIFYQGESDDQKPRIYQKLFTRLIRQWREDWEEDELPFLFVQLTMHRNDGEPDYKHWCLIREAQMRTYQTVKNTGIAVITDLGEFGDIHPKDKAPVGERLALQALHGTYKRIDDKDAFGPIYRSFRHKNGGMELTFDYAEQGFLVKEDISGFELAGVDQVYKPAKAVLEGNKIFLSSSEVLEPMYSRYCWTNYGEVTVFGSNGIPLAPFRTSRNDGM